MTMEKRNFADPTNSMMVGNLTHEQAAEVSSELKRLRIGHKLNVTFTYQPDELDETTYSNVIYLNRISDLQAMEAGEMLKKKGLEYRLRLNTIHRPDTTD